jgi:hypothetical protein
MKRSLPFGDQIDSLAKRPRELSQFHPLDIQNISPALTRNLPFDPFAFGSVLQQPFKNIQTNTNQGGHVNIPVSHKKIMRPYGYNTSLYTERGMIMITKKKDPEKYKISELTDPDNGPRYSISNLVYWNYALHEFQKYPKKWDDVIDVDTFWKEWYIEGIIEGELSVMNSRQSGVIQTFSPKEEKILQLIIRGPILTFNIWGNNITEGTKLWLILKKVVSDGKYYLNGLNEAVSEITMGDPKLSNKSDFATNKPFQFVPWADKYSSHPPPDEELIYYDEFDRKCRGKAFLIGSVFDFPDHKFTQTIKLNSIKAMIRQPLIKIWFQCPSGIATS